MDYQLKELLAQLFRDGAIHHAFVQVLGVLKDENLERMRAAVRDDDSRKAYACLETERVLTDLPSDIQRILETL